MTGHNPDRGDDLTDLKYVGPATEEDLTESDVDAEDFRNKRVSYRMLVDAGVNPGVATKIRREHSLPWSITGSNNEDLDKRSDQVRGLQDDERAWVAASTGDWKSGEGEESSDSDSSDDGGRPSLSSSPDLSADLGDGPEDAEADGSGELEAAEAAWRERSKPDPVTDVEGITEDVADRLASAGINSVRSLATADPESVGDVLGFDQEQVAEWVDAAKRLA
ncbi:hypothetical protein BRC81_13190 [Halobacteriales archaeon QS_1_68_20]|nr:MAG: hypothetical protein BRC81_13190 [Halobacteriales archaeon QS_1_68_20]